MSLSAYIVIINMREMVTYLFNFVHHFAGVVNGLEHSLDCLPASGHVVQIFLVAFLGLFSLLDGFLSLFLEINGLRDRFTIEDFSFDPVIHVEVRVSHVITQGLACVLEELSVGLVVENCLSVVIVGVGVQVEVLVAAENVEVSFVVDDRLTLVHHHVGNMALKVLKERKET